MIKESMNNSILQEDYESIAKSQIPFSNFQNKNFLITGATGLIGSNLAKTLACINRVHKLDFKIFILVRNIEKTREIYGKLLDRTDIEVLVGDITEPFSNYLNSGIKIDYIFHAAAVTTSKIMVDRPVDTIYTSIEGTRRMLELAKIKEVESFVFISSMEVYGDFNSEETTYVDENMIGYINPLAVRSNYPESKRMSENLCIAYHKQYGVPVKIARLSQTFGAGILKNENRVFAQFAKSVIDKKDIILHTDGKSEGNYCYLSDCIQALLIILTSGINAEAYNVANELSHISIADMAHMVASQIAQNSIDVKFDIPESNIFGYAKHSRIKLNTKKVRDLGWTPKYNLIDSYKRMIESML
ncbi:NAD-dependent epimerase/dehydratase family protein [Streptococcus orisratti]